jgi:type I restriction enzyme S subunit
MFGDPVRNERGWRIAKVSQIVDQSRGIRTGPFGSSLKRHEYVEQGIPVWGINNFDGIWFVENGSLFITPEKYQELTNYEVRDGDVLISRAGTTGRMCVARPKQAPSIIGTNLIRVSLADDVEPDYFVALFTFFAHRMGSLRASSDEGAYSFINPAIMQNVDIAVPKKHLQQQYAQVVKKYDRLRAQQQEGLRQAEHLFQTLLARAFRGALSTG